ncbi:MAG: hypothetical protein AAGU75_03545 [Bacillota bacterium]
MSIGCTFALFLSLLSIHASAFALTSELQNIKAERENFVFASKIEEIQPTEPEGHINISGFTTRELTDFAGNKYTLIECEPSGYLIYHDDSGVFVESSLESPSPYKSYSGVLYYGGPTNYYAEKAGKLIHTLTKEEVSPTTSRTANTFSVQMADMLLRQKDLDVLGYIEQGAPMKNTFPTSAGDTYVEDYYTIRNLKIKAQMGYLDGGYCGYIAGGMAMLYLQVHSGLLIIPPSKYLNSAGNQFKGDTFTSHLASYGSSSSTTASSLSSALNGYFNENHYIVSASWGLLVSGNTIKNGIANDQPMMLGGQYYSDPNNPGGSTGDIMHFILAYGYNNTEFIVHYGWANYNEVRINNGVLILQTIDYVKLSITP